MSALSFLASRFIQETARANMARKVSPLTQAVAARAAFGRPACEAVALELSTLMDNTPTVDSGVAAAHAVAFEAAYGEEV